MAIPFSRDPPDPGMEPRSRTHRQILHHLSHREAHLETKEDEENTKNNFDFTFIKVIYGPYWLY